jgi:predicted TIM-barrel fold metal-dependent hydrolase
MIKKFLRAGLSKVAGDFRKRPKLEKLSKGASLMIEVAYGDIAGQLHDYHAHMVGIGTGGTGCYVNHKMTSWAHPMEHLKFKIFSDAAGISNMEQADQRYVERLLDLHKNMQRSWKISLLALDKFYLEDGSINHEQTQLYVPNELVWQLSQQHPDVFVPCISIHPYRIDALQELEKWAKLGVKQVKWLPNAMGIDPSNAHCDPFYDIMKAYDMVLLCHVGKESGIYALGAQHLGNPLLLRRALDKGLKVIMAHCASLGMNIDLDNPANGLVSNHKLFIRLMEEEAYKNNLFADISAMVQVNRPAKALIKMIRRKDLHHRLVNGSDYPLPAVNAVVSTKKFVKLGMISEAERELLNEIYDHNPLLFDFVLKRTLKDPKNPENKFPPSIFTNNEALGIDVPAKVSHKTEACRR